jgi:hypothetical protein
MWGECYANANNKLKQQPKSENQKKWQGKAKNQKVHRHAAQIEAEDVSITLMITSPGGLDVVVGGQVVLEVLPQQDKK